MFDPEKVERPYVKEWGHHAVYMSDYDQLLVLYREAKAGRESFAKGMMTMRQNSHDPQTP